MTWNYDEKHRLPTKSEEDATIAGLLLPYNVVRGYVTHAECRYFPGNYIEKACFDVFPTRLTVVQTKSLLESVLEALFHTDWAFERVEWTFREVVLIDAVWMIRNAPAGRR